MTTVQFEYTDTYGGEANYCWVKRDEREIPDEVSDLALVRRAKKWAGLSGVRGRTNTRGETIEFRPYRMCTVLFINPIY